MGSLSKLVVPNPWQKLTLDTPPHVHENDSPIIERHNRKYSHGHRFHIHTQSYPEPYIGDPDAPILLLNRNPGYSACGPSELPHPALTQLMRDNLRHIPFPYPFYPVSPTYAKYHKSTWWRDSLKH